MFEELPSRYGRWSSRIFTKLLSILSLGVTHWTWSSPHCIQNNFSGSPYFSLQRWKRVSNLLGFVTLKFQVFQQEPQVLIYKCATKTGKDIWAVVCFVLLAMCRLEMALVPPFLSLPQPLIPAKVHFQLYCSLALLAFLSLLSSPPQKRPPLHHSRADPSQRPLHPCLVLGPIYGTGTACLNVTWGSSTTLANQLIWSYFCVQGLITTKHTISNWLVNSGQLLH